MDENNTLEKRRTGKFTSSRIIKEPQLRYVLDEPKLLSHMEHDMTRQQDEYVSAAIDDGRHYVIRRVQKWIGLEEAKAALNDSTAVIGINAEFRITTFIAVLRGEDAEVGEMCALLPYNAYRTPDERHYSGDHGTFKRISGLDYWERIS